MDVVVLEENHNLSLWEDYVVSHPQASNYQQLGWKTVIEQSFGHQTRYLMAMDSGVVVGILPLAILKSRIFKRSVVSLPFLNYGGLLGSHVQAEEALVSAASRLAIEEEAQ